jgi:hypothetical protein
MREERIETKHKVIRAHNLMFHVMVEKLFQLLFQLLLNLFPLIMQIARFKPYDKMENKSMPPGHSETRPTDQSDYFPRLHHHANPCRDLPAGEVTILHRGALCERGCLVVIRLHGREEQHLL